VLVIAFDRMEQGQAGQDAIAEFRKTTGVPVSALFTLDDLEAALDGATGLGQDLRARLRDYRRQYGLPAGARG
jgi:orotate phosphoribosyltransferase